MHRTNPAAGVFGTHTPFFACVVCVGLAGSLACAPDAPGEEPGGPAVVALEAAPTPAAPGSGEPNLTVDGSGVAYLSWLEPSEAGHALRFARWTDGGWGEPRTIIDRPDLFVNWADFPSLALFGDGVMAAHWLEMSGPGTYSYDVRMALSRDGGETWSDDIIPHRDGVAAEHGFVSLVPRAGDGGSGGAAGGSEGRSKLAALWLDGRATVDGAPMMLRFTTLDASGTLGPEERVDASVCDCCQTAMVATAGGLVVAYRNRTDDEVRDIYVARRVDGEWTDGRPVHDDGWVIAGCPVNGPAMAAHGDTVVVAWFTAAETGGDGAESRAEVRAAGERGRVLAAFSTDGGATFGPPVRVDDGDAMGRVDVLAPDGGRAMVSWLERAETGAEVRVRRVEPGAVGPAQTVAGAAAERTTGFPRMAQMGSRVVFAWTEPGEDGGVRTAVGTLPERADALASDGPR